MIVCNFKSYSESTNLRAVELAYLCDEVSKETGVPIIVCPNAFDLKEVINRVTIDVFTQHIDQFEPGAYTGGVSAQLAKEKGAKGTLLNHAEHTLEFEVLRECVARCREADLHVITCAENIDEAVHELELNPDEIALEIPELIAGDISIAKADPGIVRNAVERIGENRILVGAGVKDADDVKAARDLGAKGVLLASGFDLSDDPRRVIMSLAKAFI